MKLRVALFALLFLVPFAVAQDEGAVSGTVQDTSGSVIPSASVKLTSHAQGTVRTAQTNQSGVYNFSFLPAGAYDLEVSATGFRTQTRRDIILAAAQTARFDIKLEVGAVTENVTVEAETGAVNTDSAELGAVVDQTRVLEMPLNGRVFWSLTELTPGVMPPVQGSGLGYRGGINVAGSCEGCNNFTLNGMDNNDEVKTIPNFRPSIDAIEEFNVLVGVYPAQYGYGTGGQVVMITKSGTNSFHGTAFEFLRNQATDARNFFAPAGPLPSFKQNNYGGVLGGPIKKNRTFFFYAYEGLRQTEDVTALNTVPTLAMDTGDFSALLPKQVIKDPNNGAPFGGNIIPSNRLSAIGKALIAFYPAPTSPTPVGQLPSNNFNFSETRVEHMNKDSLKLDQTFSAKDSGYITANWYNDNAFEPSIGIAGCQGNFPGFGCALVNQRSEVYGLSETHIFSPSIVNEARMAFSYTAQPAIPQNASVPFWGQFGVSPFITTISSLPHLGIPQTAATGYGTLLGEASFLRRDPHWLYNDVVSWTHGKHTIKIGGSLTHFASNNANVGSATGSFTFSNTSQGPTSGYGMADLMLGLPSSTGNQPYANKLYLRASNIGAYIQDDYKVTSNLTLNLGLRWEMNTPPLDYGGHQINFNTATGLPIIQGTSPYLEYAAAGPGEHLLGFDWHDYGPRLGFAWQPFHDGKTVIRGGAGTFFNNLSYYNGLSGIYAAYPVNNTYTSSLTQPILVTNPFPASDAVIKNNLNGVFPNLTNPRIYEWSLGVQRQLTKDMLAEVTYMGSAGNHLELNQNINQPAPGAGTPTQVNARRPYPAWGTITYTEFDGNSRFNSMLMSLRKQYGYGLSFLASYTLSKSVDDLGPFTNQYNFTTGRGLSGFDVRSRFVISPVYELPFGQGKQWATQGVLAQIVGGWQIAPLFQWQTGTPLTAALSGNYTNSGGSTDRPNVTCNPNANAPHTPHEWFNTSCFHVPLPSGAAGAQYLFGNEGRDVIEGPGLVNLDVSIVRTFKVREWMKIQLRVESYNALNHPQFSFPNLLADTASFGQITGQNNTAREMQYAMKIVF